MNGSAFPFGSRGAGVLLHVSSLASPWGIGDFGLPALSWIDRLASAGIGWWQFLPVGPPGRGNSPYEPFSTFAINEFFVSPEGLLEDGLLQEAELVAAAFDPASVEFERAGKLKFEYLIRAHNRFRAGSEVRLRGEYEAFCRSRAHWLDDYALFRAVRERHNGDGYRKWPAALTAPGGERACGSQSRTR